MFSYFQRNLPNYFNNYFRLNEMIHSHNTRSASNIHIDFKRTNYGKFSLLRLSITYGLRTSTPTNELRFLLLSIIITATTD